MPLRLTNEERDARAAQMREQGAVGRSIRSTCAAADPPVRLADVAGEMGLDPESFSRYINGRRVWPDGVDDLRIRTLAAYRAVRERQGVAA